jgi:hypothetical protein
MYLGVGLRVTSKVGAGGGGTPLSTTTWNPADKASTIILGSGDLQLTSNSGSWGIARGTSSASSGKKYYEVVGTYVLFGYLMIGVAKSTATLTSYLGSDAGGYGFQPATATKYNSGSSGGYTTPAGVANGQVWSILLDITAGELRFWQNGVECNSGVAAYTGLSGTFLPAAGAILSGVTGDGLARFSSAAWSYTPPAGYTQWGV